MDPGTTSEPLEPARPTRHDKTQEQIQDDTRTTAGTTDNEQPTQHDNTQAQTQDPPRTTQEQLKKRRSGIAAWHGTALARHGTERDALGITRITLARHDMARSTPDL